MYTIYSEITKKILLKISFLFRKLATGNFKFINTYYDKKISCLMVTYQFQDKVFTDKYQNFIKSDYFTMLSKNNLNMIISAHLEMSSKSKLISLQRDITCPDVITVVNTSSSQSEDLLIKDIYQNDFYLENMAASDIRMLCQIFILNKIEEETQFTSVTGANIINFSSKKNISLDKN